MLMIERIARTIHASEAGARSAGADGRWDNMTAEQRSPFIQTAGRVLTELRQPTDAMLADGNHPGLSTDAHNVWERMIYRAIHEIMD